MNKAQKILIIIVVILAITALFFGWKFYLLKNSQANDIISASALLSAEGVTGVVENIADNKLTLAIYENKKNITKEYKIDKNVIVRKNTVNKDFAPASLSNVKEGQMVFCTLSPIDKTAIAGIDIAVGQ